MITRDRRDQALAALDRLTDLPERPPVVVIDHGSGDGTADAVRLRHPEIRVLALRGNHGAAGRNIGVAVATTPYVAFSDDDSWWDPGALAAAADVLDRNPAVALVAARVLVGDEGHDDPVNELLAHSPLPPAAGVGYPRVLGFVACAAVVRRDAFLAAHGFHPDFGVGGEEELLALDLEAGGHHSVYVDHVVARHHPAPRADLRPRRRRQVRNSLWVAWLRLPPAEAAGASWPILARGGPAAVGGVADAVRGWPRVRRRRRVLAPDVLALRRILAGAAGTPASPAGPASSPVSASSGRAAPAMVDAQDRAELLDDDTVPAGYPPDEPLGVDAYGTTAEARWGEPLDERIAREEPEVDPAETDGPPFDLLEPDEGMGPDEEATVVATLVGGAGPDDDTTLDREGVVPAEAAAMHIVDEDDLLA